MEAVRAKLIAQVERLRPFELGDDPAAWRQNDTVDRVLDIINQILPEEA